MQQRDAFLVLLRVDNLSGHDLPPLNTASYRMLTSVLGLSGINILLARVVKASRPVLA